MSGPVDALRSYPQPPQRWDAVDLLHGVEVKDPYRPLEDVAAEATREWVAAENDLTADFLSQHRDLDGLRRRVSVLLDYPKVGTPFERGGRWFQMYNEGTRAQAALYVGNRPGERSRMLIDPNTLSSDGSVALATVSASENGALVAYATLESGSEWRTWRVRDVESGKDLPDLIRRGRFSGASWVHDGAGFFYAIPGQSVSETEEESYVAPVEVRFHRLGTAAAADEVRFSLPDNPTWMMWPKVTEDGRYLVVTISPGGGRRTALMVQDLEDPDSGFQALTPSPLEDPDAGFVEQEELIDHRDGKWYIWTRREAQMGKVVRARLGQVPEQWETVVEEGPDVLVDVLRVGDRLVCQYLHHACTRISIVDLDGGRARDLALPEYTSVREGSISARAGGGLVHYHQESFTEPGAIWQYDPESEALRQLEPSPDLLGNSKYMTEQEFVQVDDGVRVPLFIVHGVEEGRDQPHRILLEGYGGFGVPETPRFSPEFAAWLDSGGIVAVACIRGGGEYGSAWHDAGARTNKRRSFDDFTACARWLIDTGWTQPSMLAITGTSNGGLLVGAALVSEPALFGGVIAVAGVYDMLRFPLATLGWAWTYELGDPDRSEEFASLYANSPLHNLQEGASYPATLITAGEHDDQVTPAHSLKFAAALQAAQGCDRPVLLQLTQATGHGAGKPTAKIIESVVDRVAFLERVLA